MMLPRLLRASESVDRLDGVAEKLAHRLRRVLRGNVLDKALRGSWIGHPTHPLIVTVPIGAWVCSAAFDALGDREAARRLIGIGALTAPAAVVTGLAEYSRLSTVQRRVGLLHLTANVAAQACYVTSHRCRSRGSHSAGMLWSALGLAAVATGGALGGHLSYALGAGVYEWQEGPEH
ncbi:DUF2231 domain-containing protein [Saccharomonospora azurea]|uniref:DUF2231 domain-containing protein n=1 Tax=Saccharomonospora azurea TaxID=40988 RepID=UPI0002400118|nr:DUF2231 domain-containing protein [Saccharomonospora azurea]EHK87579.1 hypothetical protein SZMC14600_09658 [Saccharomonospora azurea SZMC 14600]